jgi:DNA-binding GntR family transcriptional regulator
MTSPIVKHDRPQLSDEASSYVRALVMSGELPPGTPVRPEAIAESLNISTTPAREGLQALRVEGFLELLPRKGFQVAPLSGDDIRDLFRVQALIGGELAARAAMNADDNDVAELEALHHELIEASHRGDYDELETKNHQFHRRINLLAQSRKIIWALELITRYVPRQFYATIPGWPESTVQDHGRILDGIRARDPQSIRLAIEEHLSHSGELLAAHFDQRVAERSAS